MGLYNTTGIYCIENIYTHKKYIGYTRNCFGDRFDNHLNQLRHNIHKSTEMQNDYNIYGEDSFVFSIIENIDKNTSNPEEFYEKEKYYISLYDTVENGYNTSTGGRGGATGIPLSDEHIRKIAEINRKRLTNSHLSEETRKKISQSNTGKIMSEEAKEKIRQANTGKTRTTEQKWRKVNVFQINVFLMNWRIILNNLLQKMLNQKIYQHKQVYLLVLLMI